MKDLEKSFKKLADVLEKAKALGEVKGYALIGGFAVSAHARPRATKDIDFLIQAEKSFYQKTFPAIMNKQGYVVKAFKGDALDPLNGLIRIYDADGQELADLIPVFWDWQQETIDKAENIDVFGRRVPVAAIEDLIVLKLKAGGAQDLLDVQELLKVAKTHPFNKQRLQQLAKRARVDKKLAKF